MNPFSDWYKRLLSPSPLTTAEVNICLGDHSGYVRQAAVERAAKLADPAVLSMLAERLNDWVPQVRDAARTTMLELVSKLPSGAVIGILPAVLLLRQKGRWQHETWLAQFEAEMLHHVPPAALWEAVRGPDLKASRACFNVLSRHSLFAQEDLIDLALSSRDDVALAGTAANMIHQLPQPLQGPRYAAAMHSRFGRLRALGIQGLLRHPATDGKLELAFAHLLDVQAWVRQTAIAYLIAEQVDVHSHYRTWLADPTLSAAQLCIVLTALAGLRDRDDVALIRPFVQHPVATVRQAAVNAWLKLAEEDKDDIASLALADPAASIRRSALTMVRRRGAYIPFPSLLDDLIARQEWELLLDFARCGKWDLLEAVARIAAAAQASIDAVAPTLRFELDRWARSNSNFTRPTPAQAQFLTSEKTQSIFDALNTGAPSFNALIAQEIALVTK